MSSAQRDKAICQALAEHGLPSSLRAVRPLSGGCIHEVLHVTLEDGTSVVAKVNAASNVNLFHEEAKGLKALARTNTVLTPKPIGVTVAEGIAVFLMEHVEHAGADADVWARFGEELAALHTADAGDRYGFDIDNHLGTTFQPNTWCEDWVEYNAEHRLGHQIRMAHSAGLLDDEEVRALQRVIDRLDQFIPRRPEPALLHGDLWSGNALPVSDRSGKKRIAVIDPAPYVGDGWADIAMMKLFGGFSAECFERYSAAVSDHTKVPSRIAVYQLYHVLNHVNIFGRGYVAQAMSLAGSLR